MNFYSKIARSYNELHKEEQLNKLKFIIPRINKSKSLLDIGCGTGISTIKTINSVGIDPSKELIKIAKSSYPKIKFLVREAESLPFKNKSFYTVISVTAIQNFKDIKKAIKEIERVAQKLIIITCLKKSKKLNKVSKILKDYKQKDIGIDIMFVKEIKSNQQN